MRRFLLLVLLGPIAAFRIGASAGAEPTVQIAPMPSARLSDETLKNIAARFMRAYQRSTPGIWADVQACYKQAGFDNNDKQEMEECLLLDMTGKALDDSLAKRFSSPNQDWYTEDVYSQRIQQYSALSFPSQADFNIFANANLSALISDVSDAMRQTHQR